MFLVYRLEIWGSGVRREVFLLCAVVGVIRIFPR
jgi:hypothetical protein